MIAFAFILMLLSIPYEINMNISIVPEKRPYGKSVTLYKPTKMNSENLSEGLRSNCRNPYLIVINLTRLTQTYLHEREVKHQCT